MGFGGAGGGSSALSAPVPTAPIDLATPSRAQVAVKSAEVYAVIGVEDRAVQVSAPRLRGDHGRDQCFFLRLRCGSVLVDQAIEDLLASEPGPVEVGRGDRCGRLWWSPVSCSMRAMVVVVPFVLGEYAT
jgi:hypothetical protein